MKKINVIGLFVILGAIAPSVALASFSRSLSYGSSGNDVEQLQELLISENCLSSQPTGYFGILTLKGVECFQTKHSIPDTGYFGNLSIAQASSTILALTASSTAEQLAETSTTTFRQSTCPLGYSCVPITPVPATTTCPTGFICTPIAPVQFQATTTVSSNQPSISCPGNEQLETGPGYSECAFVLVQTSAPQSQQSVAAPDQNYPLCTLGDNSDNTCPYPYNNPYGTGYGNGEPCIYLEPIVGSNPVNEVGEIDQGHCDDIRG
jgi:hypothetical protein